VTYGFLGLKDHRVNNTTVHNDTSFQTTITLHLHSLGGGTDEQYGVGLNSNIMSAF